MLKLYLHKTHFKSALMAPSKCFCNLPAGQGISPLAPLGQYVPSLRTPKKSAETQQAIFWGTVWRVDASLVVIGFKLKTKKNAFVATPSLPFAKLEKGQRTCKQRRMGFCFLRGTSSPQRILLLGFPGPSENSTPLPCTWCIDRTLPVGRSCRTSRKDTNAGVPVPINLHCRRGEHYTDKRLFLCRNKKRLELFVAQATLNCRSLGFLVSCTDFIGYIASMPLQKKAAL